MATKKKDTELIRTKVLKLRYRLSNPIYLYLTILSLAAVAKQLRLRVS